MFCYKRISYREYVQKQFDSFDNHFSFNSPNTCVSFTIHYIGKHQISKSLAYIRVQLFKSKYKNIIKSLF